MTKDLGGASPALQRWDKPPVRGGLLHAGLARERWPGCGTAPEGGVEPNYPTCEWKGVSPFLLRGRAPEWERVACRRGDSPSRGPGRWSARARMWREPRRGGGGSPQNPA